MKKTKGIKPRIFYVQKLINEHWVTIETRHTFDDARLTVSCMRCNDKEDKILEFYRVVMCQVKPLEIIEFN